MDLWKSESSPGKQLALTIASVLVGVVMVIGFRDFRLSGNDAMAGFLLGVLLLTIGIIGFLYSGKQVVVIDPKNRRITVEDSNAFRCKKRLIPFNDIDDIGIGYLGKRSNYVTCYYLVLKLKDGEAYPLFAPGRFFEGGSDRLKDGEAYPLFAPGRFFEGGSDRSIVEGWRQRLQQCMNS